MADAENTTGKPPAFQFYPRDFLSDANVICMSLAERGAYITLICVCWQQGTLPSDTTRLSRLCGVPVAAFRKLWPALEPCFRPDADQPDRLVHPRLERERHKQADFKRRQSDAGKRGAGKRWHGDPMPEAIGSPSQPYAVAITGNSSASASASASSDSSQREHTHRAGAFIEWYQDKHLELFGMGYIGNPQKDYQKSVELCQGLTDAELRDAALVWFGMQDDFATRGNRTIPKFASRVAECVQIARKVSA